MLRYIEWKECPTCKKLSSTKTLMTRCPFCGQSFFDSFVRLQKQDSLEKIYGEVDRCTKCKISLLSVNQSRSKLRGIEKASKLFFVGQNPSFWRKGDRDLYSSASGKFFIKVLKDAGLDRESVFVTNLVKCSTPENRIPTDQEIRRCSEYLIREIKVVNPKIVVPLGKISCRFFDAKVGVFTKWRNYRIFGLYHPMFCLRGGVDYVSYLNYFIKLREELTW